MQVATLTVIDITNSSNIFRVGHDGTDLFVAMKGGTYKYFDVPVSVFEGFKTAASAGKYLNAEIKDKFRYEVAEVADATTLAAAMAPATNTANNSAVHGLEVTGTLATDTVKVVVMNPDVQVEYAKEGDAAFDLRAVNFNGDTLVGKKYTIPPGEHVLIGTGIKIQLPPHLCALVVPRSGLANKHRVGVVNAPGLIDSGYRGEIGVLLENRGSEPFVVNPFDRIAQLLITPFVRPTFQFVGTLDESDRGEGGFGSTGVAANPV